MAVICKPVLYLPRLDAATFKPLLAAITLNPVMKNSLPKIKKTPHASALLRIQSPIKALSITHLSASGTKFSPQPLAT